jgi:hypothetical protein
MNHSKDVGKCHSFQKNCRQITNGGAVVKYDSCSDVLFTRKTSRNAAVSTTIVVKYDSPLVDCSSCVYMCVCAYAFAKIRGPRREVAFFFARVPEKSA